MITKMIPEFGAKAIKHREPPSNSTAFNKLPIELNWNIAHYLSSDKDIATFRSICRQTRDAIDGDKGSFWRAAFREKYAYAVEKCGSNERLRREYQQRSKRLRRGTSEKFRELGHRSSEVKVVNVLRSLIVDSFQGSHGRDEHGRPLCPNQEHLMSFIRNSQFLAVRPSSSRSPNSKAANKPDAAFTAVQLMCAQLLFQMDSMKYDILSFDESQKMAYEHYREQPIFNENKSMGDLQVNMDWALHCLNFFRHHMVREEAATLYETMVDMDPLDCPTAWKAPLQEGSCPLSRNWKGTYAYLESHEVDKIREKRSKKKGAHDDVFMDKNIEEGGNIQDLVLDFVPADQLTWPDAFESRLQSHRETIVPKTRAQHRAPKAASDPVSIRLQGEGLDQDDHFFASGWLNPLEPQQGIPGWQRITFMKHFEADYNQIPNDDLWAYEGVVLPGGRLIFGRWWFANDEASHPNYGRYSGPFILWAVDSNLALTNSDDDDQ